MSIIRTERAIVLWSPESVYGQFPGVCNRRFGIHETIVAPDPEFGWRPLWDVGHLTRSRRTILRGRLALRGSVPDILCQPTTAQRELFGMALGKSSAGSVTEGIGTYDERIPSFTTQIVYRDTNNVSQLIRTYLGCKINRATWSAREGEELRFSIDEFLAKMVVHNRAGQAFYNSLAGVGVEAADPGPSAAGRYIFSGAEIKALNGSLTLARARRFSLTIDNQLEPRYYLSRSGDTNSFTQVLTDIVEGKRVYSLEIEIDLGDPATDLAWWDFLINQGGPGGTATVGTTITAAFKTEAAEGVQEMAFGIDSTLDTKQVGAVLKSANFGIPAPPAGLVPVTLSFDVRSIGIITPN